eukprot:5053481-Pyramimonas_sp.AAC.2
MGAIVGGNDVSTAPEERSWDEEQDVLEQINLAGEPMPEGSKGIHGCISFSSPGSPSGDSQTLLRISRMPSGCIEAAKNYRCESCEILKSFDQTHKVALPKKFCFYHRIAIDCLEVKDKQKLRSAKNLVRHRGPED